MNKKSFTKQNILYILFCLVSLMFILAYFIFSRGFIYHKKILKTPTPKPTESETQPAYYDFDKKIFYGHGYSFFIPSEEKNWMQTPGSPATFLEDSAPISAEKVDLVFYIGENPNMKDRASFRLRELSRTEQYYPEMEQDDLQNIMSIQVPQSASRAGELQELKIGNVSFHKQVYDIGTLPEFSEIIEQDYGYITEIDDGYVLFYNSNMEENEFENIILSSFVRENKN